MLTRQPNKDAVEKLLSDMESNFEIYLKKENIQNFITEKNLKIESKSIKEKMAIIHKAFLDNEYYLDAQYLKALKKLHNKLARLKALNEKKISKEKATYTQIGEVYNALQQTNEQLNLFRTMYICGDEDLSVAAENLIRASANLYGTFIKRDALQKAGDVFGTMGAAIAGFIIGAILAATVIVPLAIIIWDIYKGTLTCSNFLTSLFAPITYPIIGASVCGNMAHEDIKEKQFEASAKNCCTLFKPALCVVESHHTFLKDNSGNLVRPDRIINKDNDKKFSKIPGINLTRI